MIDPDDPMLAPLALRSEMLGHGYNDQALARAVAAGQLVRPRRGAYVDGDIWRSLDPRQRYAVRARAVSRQARTALVLSHVSALPFLGAPLTGHPLDDVHVTRLDGRTGRAEAGVRQHRGVLQEGDVLDVCGVKVTAPARAIIECAAVSPAEATLVAADDLLHRGLCTFAELEQRASTDMERWPGTLSMHVVLMLADARIESPGESRLNYVFHTQSLPRPVPQFEVTDDDGFRAFLDFALPQHGVWFEFDGMHKYAANLRPGETTADAVLREKRREDRIRELTGWRCMRITWADLADPVRLGLRVRAFIAAGTTSAAAPTGT